MPNVLVISDFPIIQAAARSVFGDRHTVIAASWTNYRDKAPSDAEFVIVDVTALPVHVALTAVEGVLPSARVAVCSLNQNEIEIYRLGLGAPEMEGELPSLLELSA